MKNSKKIFIAILVVLFGSVSFAILNVKAKLNSEIQELSPINAQQHLDFDLINKLTIESGVRVEYISGEKSFIDIEGSSADLDLLLVSEKDGELTLSKKKMFSRFERLRVLLTCPTLKKVDASSGSSFNCKSIIENEKVKVYSSSGASANVKLKAEDIRLVVASGASLNAQGSTGKVVGKSSSGSVLMCDKLISDHAEAVAASGGSIRIGTVNQSINAEAKSGGDISFKGEAKLQKNTSSGGKVIRI